MCNKPNQFDASMNLEPLESRQMFSAAPSIPATHFPQVTVQTPHVFMPAAPAIAAPAAQLSSILVHTVVKFPLQTVLSLHAEPNLGMPGISYQNFSGDPLFGANGPSESDVVQGDVGDCYFVATLASIAREDPNQIRQDITAQSNGTYDVRFFSNGKAIEENVDAELPVWNNSSSLVYAQLGQGNSLWVALMEKAFAVFRDGGNTYGDIGGGWTQEVYTDLGLFNAWTSLSSSSNYTSILNSIANDLTFRDSVTVSTVNPGTSNNVIPGTPLVGPHVYSVDAVTYNANGVPIGLTVRNPWGTVGVSGYASNNGFVTLTIANMQAGLDELDVAVV